MHPTVNIAITAARAASEIMLRYIHQLDRIKVTAKNEYENFSEVDVRAEQAIIDVIHKAFPDHGILAEESGIQNPDSTAQWIIDPLDGTTNYLQGFPFFCVSIALKVNDRLEHGVILDPIRQECFSASRGGGARLNDRRIRVSEKLFLKDALIGTGFPAKQPALASDFLSIAEPLFGHCAGVRRTGSAALDLAYVASGRLDAFWEFGLRPWDIAAGTLIVREAGGLVSDFSGGESFLEGGDIVAGSPKIFKALLQKIRPVTSK